MSDLHFHCPAHRQDIDTGISVDEETLERTRLNLVHVPCPHCGGMHRFLLADAHSELVDVSENISIIAA